MPEKNDNITLKENPIVIPMDQLIKAIFIFCILSQILMIVADYYLNYVNIFDDKNIRNLWNIARENSIPSWYSATQAQILGIIVLFIAFIQKDAGFISGKVAWIIAGSFFLWVGIDDASSIHERLGSAINNIVRREGLEATGVVSVLAKNPSFAWHKFIAPLYALITIGIAIFVWPIFLRAKLLHYIILGFGCWAVAQAIDFTEGLKNIDEFYNLIKDTFEFKRFYGVTHLFKVVEEVLETFGTTLLLIGFLKYLAKISSGLSVQFK